LQIHSIEIQDSTMNSRPKLPDGLHTNDLIRHLLQNDFPSFIRMCFKTLNPETAFDDNWHILAIAHHLEQVRLGVIKRGIITMPPRSLKSISASVAFPAFIHGKDPSKNIIAVSYGQELSAKHQNDYRLVLSSPWYQAIFPQTRISKSKDTETEVVLTNRGGRLATSIGGTLTGRGADIIIIDDPLKPGDAPSETKRRQVNDWYGSTLSSRLNNKNDGAIIIVTQRVHTDDLVGHVMELSPEGWDVLNLPAIASQSETIPVGNGKAHNRKPGDLLHPKRETQMVLDSLRRDLGSDNFEAQYQQMPVPPGGLMFKRDWLKRYTQLPDCLDNTHKIIQSWDTASKTGPTNDWSVCTTWLVQQNLYYLLDVSRVKLDYPALRAQAVKLADQHKPSIILVEDAGVGTGLITDLQHNGCNVIPVTPKQSKEARASVQSAKVEGGRVLLPSNASWLSEFEAELLAFPGSRHDDQVDSMVQALQYEIPSPVRMFTRKGEIF
jgi:predicted phage terminase large subunit-like protein